jgi:hypothetical protein
MFCLGLVISREHLIRTIIGTVSVHIFVLPPRSSPCCCHVMCSVVCWSCAVIALFCVVPRPSDTSIVVLGFMTHSTVREELQSHLIYVYKLHM